MTTRDIVDALSNEHNTLEQTSRTMFALRWAVSGGLFAVALTAVKFGIADAGELDSYVPGLVFGIALGLSLAIVALNCYFEILHLSNLHRRSMAGQALATIASRSKDPVARDVGKAVYPAVLLETGGRTGFSPWLQGILSTAVVAVPAALFVDRLWSVGWPMCLAYGTAFGVAVSAVAVFVYMFSRCAMRKELGFQQVRLKRAIPPGERVVDSGSGPEL